MLRLSLAVQHKTQPDAWQTLVTESLLGEALLGQNKHAEAERVLRPSLAGSNKIRPNHGRTLVTESLLGEALLGQNRFAEAEPLLLNGYQRLTEKEDVISPIKKQRILKSIQRLIQLYESWHEIDPDAGHDTKAAQWHKTLQEHEERLSLNQTK